LAKHGYIEAADTPCLFAHVTRAIKFTLVVDDFMMRYDKDDDSEHLIAALRAQYPLKVDPLCSKYIILTIKYDRAAVVLDISMPGYVEQALHRFQVQRLSTTNSPLQYVAPMYGARQQIAEQDTSNTASASET
jgi:hypothetical protein